MDDLGRAVGLYRHGQGLATRRVFGQEVEPGEDVELPLAGPGEVPGVETA